MFLNEEIFISFYKALVHSHFDYAMSTWNPHMINLYSTKHRNNLNIQIQIMWCT